MALLAAAARRLLGARGAALLGDREVMVTKAVAQGGRYTDTVVEYSTRTGQAVAPELDVGGYGPG